MHNTRGNYSVLTGTGSFWQESCRQGWNEFSRKFTKRASWRRSRTCRLKEPSSDRCSACLSALPFSWRHKQEGALCQEEQDSAGRCRDPGYFPPEGRPPPQIILQPLGPPSRLAWRCHPDGGAGNHPRTEHGQEVSQEKRGANADSQVGCMADPASLSQGHAGDSCPGKRVFQVLERGD